jgi:uncharacterized protein YciI
MRYYAVTRERGASWDRSRPMREQDRWDDHAAFMDGLVDEGLVVLGGPIGDGDRRFLLIFDAASQQEIHAHLAEDPWTPMELLRVVAIEPWEILLGERSV